MNTELKEYARDYLARNLVRLPEAWQQKFKLMYGRDNGRRSVDDAFALSMSEVIAEIPEERLDWAMTQVKNSLAKLETRDEA